MDGSWPLSRLSRSSSQQQTLIDLSVRGRWAGGGVVFGASKSNLNGNCVVELCL